MATLFRSILLKLLRDVFICAPNDLSVLRHCLQTAQTQAILYSWAKFFFLWRCSSLGPWPSHFWGLQITLNDKAHSLVLLWTSDPLVAKNSTWRHTTLTRDKYPCSWRDSNPLAQKAGGRRPTPWTARPPRSAHDNGYRPKLCQKKCRAVCWILNFPPLLATLLTNQKISSTAETNCILFRNFTGTGETRKSLDCGYSVHLGVWLEVWQHLESY
jgi:hypothetical protein